MHLPRRRRIVGLAPVVEPVGSAGRLLNLVNDDAGTKGVNRPGGHQHRQPGLGRDRPQQHRQRLFSPRRNRQLRVGHPRFRADVEHRAGFGVEHMPGFGLAEAAMRSGLVGWVNLDREGALSVDEFHQQRKDRQSGGDGKTVDAKQPFRIGRDRLADRSPGQRPAYDARLRGRDQRLADRPQAGQVEAELREPATAPRLLIEGWTDQAWSECHDAPTIGGQFGQTARADVAWTL